MTYLAVECHQSYVWQWLALRFNHIFYHRQNQKKKININAFNLYE